MSTRTYAATRFDVWAPEAQSVTLLAGGDKFPLAPLDAGEHSGQEGWWGLTEASAAPEAAEIDYGYLLDDEDHPLPDPRSRRQPAGVHELSRTFDPTAYRWSDGQWKGRQLAGGSIYELHLGTFTPEGTLDAAIGKLDYLVQLGVDFLELLPVNAFNGTHNWGYDGVLWYAVQEQYGGPEAYQRFVDAAHQRGLGVIQDVVYNHLGPSGNYLSRFGPYLNSGSGNTWGDSLNLDGENSDPVRDYILENALGWMRNFHVDGLRLDAVHALSDTRAVHLLEEMAQRTDALSAQLGKPLFLIAESDLNDPRLLYPRAANGYGLTGQWSDDFHHAVHVNVTGENEGYYADFDSIAALAKVLTKGFYHDGSLSTFRGRHHGRPIDVRSVATWQLVVCIQNHDQIGNRATGDRLSAKLGYNQLALAAVLNLAGPFTPMLFMGEEFAASTPWQFFTSHPEPELGKATAEGRIAEFAKMGWDPAVVPDPQDPKTFTRSKLNWAEASEGEHARLLETYRDLLALRRATPELNSTSFLDVDVEFSESDRWLVLHRTTAEGRVSIACNFSDTDQTLPVDAATVLFATVDAGLTNGKLTLPAQGAAILR
ncbi:MAG: malto-oligosyltrehalose trehalohydrolase [Micrococcaceae bacterium]|nr:malto-oligosyltrehalose trehalohydrolase [Micrococcaceae bacterium]